MAIFKKVLLIIGKYILATIALLVALLTLGSDMAILHPKSNVETLLILAVFALPIISIFPKSYPKGIVYMFVATICINFIVPILNLNKNGTNLPFGLGGIEINNSDEYENESINGTYTADIGGAYSSLTVIGDTWYGENREASMGGFLGNSTGMMDGNRIINEYGQEIGYINGNSAFISMGGQRIVLKKE